MTFRPLHLRSGLPYNPARAPVGLLFGPIVTRTLVNKGPARGFLLSEDNDRARLGMGHWPIFWF